MKKMMVLLAGVLLATGLNAGDVVDAADMKKAKDIGFTVESCKYIDSGDVGLKYVISIKEEVKNPLGTSIQLNAALPNKERYYVNIGGGELKNISPGKGDLAFQKEFSLLKPYHLKQKKIVAIKETDVPAKIRVYMVVFARKPHTQQAIKGGSHVGNLIVEKDDKGKIKSVKYEKKS